jgi:hypothetical protein
MGLKPLEPGFKRFELRPQHGDLNDLDLTAFTVQGPVSLRFSKQPAGPELFLQWPPNAQGELVLPQAGAIDLPELANPAPAGHRRFKLPASGTLAFRLKADG